MLSPVKSRPGPPRTVWLMSHAQARRAPRDRAHKTHVGISPILDLDEDFSDEQPAEWATPHWSSDEETPGLHMAEWDALDD